MPEESDNIRGHDEPTIDPSPPSSGGARDPFIGRKIGSCTLRRVIGRGGMGTVYEAVQDNPRRAVAVKMMRRGIASKKALRRFEFEAQILGRLKHSGIAAVYDAGSHDDGEGAVPYFVMEYIPNATPLTQYAIDKKLGTRERLDLFTKVCEAVQHGHMKGIVHRDLKPGNIIVDTSGQPKIIDFGVARSTDSDLAVTTLQTDVGALIGTLQYMSPEQVAADPHDIDTRSDVYSLGMILYELLTGKTPYDVRTLAIHEAVQIIRDEEPTRLSTIDRHLRGDIETIAIKALDKERSQRYQSAGELRDDIQRYLSGEAIAATPPSAWSQFRRFAKRNIAATVAGASIFFVIIIAVIGISWFAVNAANERAMNARAQSQMLEKEEAARVSAETAEIAMNFAADMTNASQISLAAADLGVDADAFVDNLLTRKEQLARVRFSSDDLEHRRALGEVLLQVGYGHLAQASWDRASELLLEGVEIQRNASVGFRRGGNSLQSWMSTRGVAPALLLLHGVSKIDLELTEEQKARVAPLWEDAQPLLAEMDMELLGRQISNSLYPQEPVDTEDVLAGVEEKFRAMFYGSLVSQELGLTGAFDYNKVANTLWMLGEDPEVELRITELGVDLMESFGFQQPAECYAELEAIVEACLPLLLAQMMEEKDFGDELTLRYVVQELNAVELIVRIGNWATTYGLQSVIDSLGSQPFSKVCEDIIAVLNERELWNSLEESARGREEWSQAEFKEFAISRGVSEEYWQDDWANKLAGRLEEATRAATQDPVFLESFIAKLLPLDRTGVNVKLEGVGWEVGFDTDKLESWLRGVPNADGDGFTGTIYGDVLSDAEASEVDASDSPADIAVPHDHDGDGLPDH